MISEFIKRTTLEKIYVSCFFRFD